MFISAIYVETGEQCYVNTDFVVDIFIEATHLHLLDTDSTRYIAFTFDNERRGYAISKEDFWKLLGEGGEDE